MVGGMDPDHGAVEAIPRNGIFFIARDTAPMLRLQLVEDINLVGKVDIIIILLLLCLGSFDFVLN